MLSVQTFEMNILHYFERVINISSYHFVRSLRRRKKEEEAKSKESSKDQPTSSAEKNTSSSTVSSKEQPTIISDDEDDDDSKKGTTEEKKMETEQSGEYIRVFGPRLQGWQDFLFEFVIVS